MKQLLREVLRRPLGRASLLVLLALYLGALFAGFLATQPVNQQNLEATYHPPTRLAWHDGGVAVQAYRLADKSGPRYEAIPGEYHRLRLFAPGFDYKLLGLIPLERHLLQPAEPEARLFLLGSDSTGRCVFSRLVYGSRVSLVIGLIGITITMVLGLLVGGLSGYFGGKIDFFAMRGVEFLMAIPSLYLLLALRSVLAPRFSSDQMFFVIVIILSLIGWAGAARVLRGMTLSIRRRQFVLAAESMGQSPLRILRLHILPNLASYLLVAATLSIPGYILGEAALSFLGLGIAEPASSWGLMLSQAQNIKIFMLNFWWLLTPGAAIFVTVIAFNLLGDVLRDIVDPRMKTQ
jgi:peptide/nickel transport system permease protein